MLDFETYKVDIGGSFEFIRPVTRGRYTANVFGVKFTDFSRDPVSAVL